MNVTRGVLAAGKFRTHHQLNTMSPDDQRNTLTVEMAGRSNQSVGAFQAMNDAELAGAGAAMVFLRATGSAARHSHHGRQPGLLPHGAPGGAVDPLRRAVGGGLRRAARAAARGVEGDARATSGRPGDARAGAARRRVPRAAAAPLPRRGRRHQHRGADGRRPAGRHRVQTAALDLARVRRMARSERSWTCCRPEGDGR